MRLYEVKFIGERGRPATDEVTIAGLVFRKGQELCLGDAQVAALRAHRQFGQFKFGISGVVVGKTATPASRTKKRSVKAAKRKAL